MICPSCGQGVLEPTHKSNTFAIIKESVTTNELEQEKIFTLVGKSKRGKPVNSNIFYLQKEMGMAGLQLSSFSLTSLYLHIPPGIGAKGRGRPTKEDRKIVNNCNEWSLHQAVEFLKDMKVVLIMGAEVVRLFTGHGVSTVSSLICKSELLPKVPVVIPAPNPDKLMNQPIGELRLALRVFAEQIEIYNQYEET